MTELQINTDFRKLVQQGKLSLFRDFLKRFSYEKFQDALQVKRNKCEAIAISQRLITIISSKANVSALARQNSNKTPIFCLPKDAARHLGLSGAVMLISQINFGVTLAKLSTKRFLNALLLILEAKTYPNENSKAETVYIFDISSNALNKEEVQTKQHTLETWMRANSSPSSIIIFHSVKSRSGDVAFNRKYVNNFLPYLPLRLRALIFGRAVLRYLFCMMSLAFGRWAPLIMIDDWVYCQFFSYANSSEIYHRYCFLFQGHQYRPAWTYIAEQKGGKAVLVNYSANFVPSLDKKLHDRDYLNTATWTEIIPFNQQFARYTESNIGKHSFRPRVFRAESTFLYDNAVSIVPSVERAAIALFDVQPLDEKYHIGFMDQHDYIDNNNFQPGHYNEIFIKNVVKAAQQTGFDIILKPKRKDPRVLESYQNLISDLEARGSLTVASTDIAPSRLLENVVGGIILPFSTVGYFEVSGVKLCFYDVVGCFNGSHQAAFGRDLISSFEDLVDWMTLLKEQA